MIEDKNLTPVMVQYKEIKEAHKDYLLFYRMGDFYELFFDDAIVASKALDITLTKRGKVEDLDIPMCGVPFHAYESYLARLIHQGYKVAICEQVEDPKEAKKRGSKSIVKREVIRLVTPGTITEETLLNSKRNNYLLCVSKINNTMGIAWIDLSTGVFYTQEIKFKPENEASELMSALARLLPSEVLIADSMLENPQLFALLNEYKDKLSILPQARFNSNNSEKNILEYYGVETLDSFGNFSKAEITSAGILLDYISNTQKGKMPRIDSPVKILASQIMEIDASTRNNLDLLEGAKGCTLISVIDRTITGAGARMLASNLANPSLDLEIIHNRYDAIEFFINHDETRCELRNFLHDCPDVERAISRLSVGRGGPRDLQSICMMLCLLPKIKSLLNMYKQNDVLDEVPDAIYCILNKISNYSSLTDNLLKMLDDDLPLLARDGGFVKEGYNVELDNLRHLKDEGGQYIINLQNKYAEQTGIDHLKIKYNNVIGYFIEVPSKFSQQMLANPNFIHRQSILNATRFTTVELTELENDIRSSSEKALAVELSIYDEMVKRVLLEAEDIIRNANALAELDVASSLADLAIENNYCRPIVDNSNVFIVEEGRHPIVETAIKRNNEGVFVGNDCNLDISDNRIWLITGPNMAGKSTFLRQNAVIAIMAQMGSYVPAKSAHIGLIDKVFSRVGASDDLARGRSTFMVEMVETASILNRATERSFVILDEIGRGTATFDGLSIAWAVVEYLHEVNRCRSLFATHYHELTNLVDKLKSMTLHCMKIKEFNDEVIFLHEVIDGTADRSYGIHVAKLAGLPNSVLKRSEQVLKKLENNNQAKVNLSMEDELPLFSYHAKETNSEVEKLLEQINPDDLTAREALQKLYDLKDVLQRSKHGN